MITYIHLTWQRHSCCQHSMEQNGLQVHEHLPGLCTRLCVCRQWVISIGNVLWACRQQPVEVHM